MSKANLLLYNIKNSELADFASKLHEWYEQSALQKYKAIFRKFCSMIGWFIFRPHLRALQQEFKEQNMEIAK